MSLSLSSAEIAHRVIGIARHTAIDAKRISDFFSEAFK